ncbi:MAG: hypothetical protein JWO81_1337 [Alphaproteobacteria bacterium]|nr:hypothetical protein [Alphaproteobacteria bacterium]
MMLVFLLSLAGLPISSEPIRFDQSPPRANEKTRALLSQYRSFAECVASADWQLAKPVFDTPIGTKEERRILERAAERGRCGSSYQGTFWNTQLRLAVAAARYRKVYPAIESHVPTSNVGAAPAAATFAWVGSTGNGPWQQFQFLANCLAERETGLVDALLRTPEDSAEERWAMQSLGRQVGPCLRTGQQLRISGLEFRSWLGEAQYQLARSRRPDEGQ